VSFFDYEVAFKLENMLLQTTTEQAIANNHLFEVIFAAFGILLSIIGFFLSYYFRRLMRTQDNLNNSVTGLNTSVQLLNQTMEGYDERLKDSEKKIQRHDRSIACIKTVLKISKDDDGE
jgi:hypothetical protein